MILGQQNAINVSSDGWRFEAHVFKSLKNQQWGGFVEYSTCGYRL